MVAGYKGTDMDDSKKASLGAMAAAAAALVSGVGALTLTGALGRVQRNNGLLFGIGLLLVVLGAAAWVVGALISPEARPLKRWKMTIGIGPGLQGVGVVASLIGLVVALLAAVATANDTEQPSVKLTLADDGKTATGVATVANLSSQDRLTVNVDGLTRQGSDRYAEANLFQGYVGPDSDGKATIEAKVPLPPDRFDALGIRAWTAGKPDDCGAYPTDQADPESGTGCIILQLTPVE
jgi:hypothetical protein